MCTGLGWTNPFTPANSSPIAESVGHQHTGTRVHRAVLSMLKRAYGIDVSLDSKLIHPVTFCTPCYSAMGRILKSGMVKSSVVVFDWTEHRDDCKVYKVKSTYNNISNRSFH